MDHSIGIDLGFITRYNTGTVIKCFGRDKWAIRSRGNDIYITVHRGGVLQATKYDLVIMVIGDHYGMDTLVRRENITNKTLLKELDSYL